ncbi:MAG: type II toxin-antitoxin system VapC family toxin [Candidatus Solibacter usitatus]|nr:type II toxin-antitoxin system VapC family toxin [Candidatus Solibacter usitatus]
MILDTSALVAILFAEPEAEQFSRMILEADVCRVSVVSYLELTIVLERQARPEAARQAEAFLRTASIVVEPVTLQQGALARQAYFDFGRGRHRARLNFGDCFAYALARAMDEPLLFKGNDFLRTDVRVARAEDR